jgi:phosphatidylglycerol:prolipoprotein diacylglycerol transferase
MPLGTLDGFTAGAAMLPYIAQPTLTIGPVTIHAFGVLVAIGVLVGARVLGRRVAHESLDPEIASSLLVWLLACGFVGAHLVDRLIYFPRETLAHPLTLVEIWSGLSSFGGFAGAALGIAIASHRARLGARAFRYVDAIAYAFPFGWFFGRMGCFLAFDHPGVATNAWIGERFVDGVVRHNLGLEEALFFVPLAALFVVLGRRRRSPGFFAGLLAALYAPVRFYLDTLRVVDVRYAGLTPGQWGAVALFVTGLVILLGGPRRSRVERARIRAEEARAHA